MQRFRVIQPVKTQDNSIRVSTASSPESAVKYDKQCRSVLGDVGALLTYAYATLHPEMTRGALATWIQGLRDASKKQKEVFRSPRTAINGQARLSQKTVIAKPQASVWAKASPVAAKFPTELSEGWNYRLIDLPIIGVAPGMAPWRANLIVVLERRSGQVFHQFIGERRSFRLGPEQVIYLLAQVDKAMAAHPLAATHADQPRSVWLPAIHTHSDDEQTVRVAAAYADVLNLFNDNAGLSDQVLVQWMSSPKLWVNPSRWQAHPCAQTVSPFVMAVPPAPTQEQKSIPKHVIVTARHLGNAILRHTSQLECWRSLTPPKAHARLDPERFAKRPLPQPENTQQVHAATPQ